MTTSSIAGFLKVAFVVFTAKPSHQFPEKHYENRFRNIVITQRAVPFMTFMTRTFRIPPWVTSEKRQLCPIDESDSKNEDDFPSEGMYIIENKLN